MGSKTYLPGSIMVVQLALQYLLFLFEAACSNCLLFMAAVHHFILCIGMFSDNFSGKHSRSFRLNIAASKAQSPTAGFGLPGLVSTPCFEALKTALQSMVEAIAEPSIKRVLLLDFVKKKSLTFPRTIKQLN